MPDPDCGSSVLKDPLVCPICGKPSQKIRRALTPSGYYRCVDCLIKTAKTAEGRQNVSQAQIDSAISSLA